MSAPRSSMRRRSRRPALSRGDERELALLNVAESLLTASRFEEASLEEIAAGAGISRPTFYFYFDSKQALLISLVERTLDDLTADISQALRPLEDDPAQALRAMLRRIAELWWKHRSVLMTAAELAGSAPSVFERIQAVAESQFEVAQILHRIGGSPLVRDRESAERLARRFGWMVERNFYVVARTAPTRRRLLA